MDVVTWEDDRRVHSNHACRAQAGVGPGETHRVRFGADIASRMCSCCCVEPAAADDGLAVAVFELVGLCEVLDEEADEAENREETDYVPDFLRSDFNRDHWRSLQFLLSATTNGLLAHPWLLRWTGPSLSRAAAYAERRCEEQRTLIDTATVEKAAVALQKSGQPTAQLAQAWQAWRQREDWNCDTSPDYAYYDRDARLQPPSPHSAGLSAATVAVSVRLPPIGRDEEGFRMVETLSTWELTAIAAYKATADWAGSSVTLAVPPAVAQELLSPARALDVTPLPPGTGRGPRPPAAP
ncbi:hypothetical protein ACWEFL_35755 [Streptomyces sp. NPDC004838]